MIQGQSWDRNPGLPSQHHTTWGTISHSCRNLFGSCISELSNKSKRNLPRKCFSVTDARADKSPKEQYPLHVPRMPVIQWLSQAVFIRSLRQTHILKNANMIPKDPCNSDSTSGGPLMPLPFLLSDIGQDPWPTKSEICSSGWKSLWQGFCITQHLVLSIVFWVNREVPQAWTELTLTEEARL